MSEKDILACLSKREYKTFEAVGQHIIWAEEKFNRKLYTYHCPVCGHWHVTSKRRRGKKNENT